MDSKNIAHFFLCKSHSSWKLLGEKKYRYFTWCRTVIDDVLWALRFMKLDNMDRGKTKAARPTNIRKISILYVPIEVQKLPERSRVSILVQLHNQTTSQVLKWLLAACMKAVTETLAWYYAIFSHRKYNSRSKKLRTLCNNFTTQHKTTIMLTATLSKEIHFIFKIYNSAKPPICMLQFCGNSF